MTTNNSAISFEKTTIGNIADTIYDPAFNLDDLQQIDGDGHILLIWKDATGKTKISIQGTGEGVTLLTVDTAEMVDMGASQWAGDDHAAMSVRPH